MPELPEMETYRRLLAQRLVGQTITDVYIGREKSLNVQTERFIRSVRGHVVTNIGRRAKYLLFTLDSGDHLLLHLMLGGWMFWGTEADRPDRTIQVRLDTAAGSLYFIGLRLGYLHLLDEVGLAERLQPLGPEPLQPAWTCEQWLTHMTKRRGRLKTQLVDQQVIAGIGNCYADEICFDAAIHPARTCPSLTEIEWERLYASVQRILTAAIRYGGYMEHPFYTGDPWTGGFDERCLVYDREGEPCPRCGTAIVRTSMSGRKLFFCPACQQ